MTIYMILIDDAITSIIVYMLVSYILLKLGLLMLNFIIDIIPFF